MTIVLTLITNNNYNNDNDNNDDIKHFDNTGFVQTLNHSFPGLSRTCKVQLPGFTRTQRTHFRGLQAPPAESGAEPWKIRNSVQPETSKVTTEIPKNIFPHCKHAVRLIMCKSYQGLDADHAAGGAGPPL